MMTKQQESETDQVLIQGPRRHDVIQISRGDFDGSHYAEQGYEIVGTPVEIDPDAPKDVPDDGLPAEGE